jgi:hypothetical protein
MTMDRGPRFPEPSTDVLGLLPSSPPPKDDWANSPTRVTRRHSRVLSPTSHANGPSPKMRLVPLHEDSKVNASDAASASRGRSFSLAKVFGSKKPTKERSASVGPLSAPPRPVPAQQRSPSVVPILPPSSTAADITDLQAALRKQEYARQLHAASAGTSYLPTHAQAPMYRHRVNQPFQPSARFAAAISVGFSPAQANAILAVAAPPEPQPTKYGMQRLPRGTLSPDKLLYLDWALNYIADQRGRQDEESLPEAGQEMITPSRSRQDYREHQLPSDRVTSTVTASASAHELGGLGLVNGPVEAIRQQGLWHTPTTSTGVQGNSPAPAGWTSSTSSPSAYQSANSLLLAGSQELRPRPCASSRSDSADSCPSSSTSHLQACILADLASDEGAASQSSCEEINETEVLLDEQDMQASKDARSKRFSIDVAHAEAIATRRRSSVMSGILGTLTSPVAQNINFPNMASSTPPNNGLLSPSSLDGSTPYLAPPGSTLASPTSTADSVFLRRPSWTFMGRRTSVSQNQRPLGSLLSASGESSRNSNDATSRTSCEPYRGSEVAPSAEKNSPPTAGAPRLSPRQRLLSLGQAKTRLEHALGIPIPAPK